MSLIAFLSSFLRSKLFLVAAAMSYKPSLSALIIRLGQLRARLCLDQGWKYQILVVLTRSMYSVNCTCIFSFSGGRLPCSSFLASSARQLLDKGSYVIPFPHRIVCLPTSWRPTDAQPLWHCLLIGTANDSKRPLFIHGVNCHHHHQRHQLHRYTLYNPDQWLYSPGHLSLQHRAYISLALC